MATAPKKTSSDVTLTPLNPAGEEREALFAQFSQDCQDAGLKTVEVEISVCGRQHIGPAVNVRDLTLVTRATKLKTVTAASGEDTFYVIPVMELISLD